MVALLHAENLSRRYARHRGVEAFTLRLARGDIVGLAGLNGAGKSTTLAMLAGVLRPSHGHVIVDGRDVHRDPRARLGLGFAPDQPPLYPELTVREYLSYCAALHGLDGQTAKDAVQAVLESCQLEEVASRLIRPLSRGFRQRVGLAQALVHRPPVLLLDEPSDGLDPQQVTRFRSLVSEHATDGAVLLSTHQLDVIAGLCNRLMILHDGRVVMDRPLENESSTELHALFASVTGASITDSRSA